MKERGGLATTIALVIAAVFGASYLPRKSGDTTTATEGQRTPIRAVSPHAKSQQASSKIEPLTSCQQIATRLRRFYGTDIVPGSAEAGCYGKGVQGPAFSLPANSSVVFAIAIVPNPVQTHLPLLFDRAIEAIQQAAQDTNYSYDGSWFPWNQSQKSYESLTDEEQSAQFEAELQEQPGIMVFRSGVNQPKEPYEGGLAIFVVAEQPTGGISDAQFEHALHWMSALQSTPSSHKLRIIGPTFSGSLSSLARELEIQKTFLNYPNGIEIFSGATNADENVTWFENTLRPEDEFRTFLESDSLMTDRFLCYLQHEGYDLNHVAILSEDQTAFGKAKVSKEEKGESPGEPRCQDHQNRYEGTPVYLYYPRDIATLRSAYEQQGIFSAGKQQANAPATSLKQDLSEPASSQHDTVRTYGGQLTPLAQEAELFGIANILSTNHIEFVILRSSNSIDQLFLSEFLRRSYPGGRVVIDGADLLFRRGMQGASLRGVILLSPYPLLSWTHGEIPTLETEPTTSYRVFPQDLSEGIYIAARELLKDLPGARPKIPISDYAPPRWALSESSKQGSANQRPATWVTVVGHRQFWPLAVLNEQTEVENDAPQTPYGPAGNSLLKPEAGEPGSAQGSTGLPGEMSGLIVFCVLLSLWHLYCCAKGSIVRPPRLRAYFAPIPKLQHASLIFIGSLLLGLLGVTLWYGVRFGLAMLSASFTVGVGLGALLIVGFAFFGCVQNYRLPVVVGEVNRDKQKLLDRIQQWRQKLVWAWIPALAVLAILRHFYLTYHLTIANRFPVYWRSVYLRSGVSALLPQVLLILGLYAWFWFNLHGLALFGDDRPVLPKIDDLPRYEAPADRGEEEHGQHTRWVKMFRVFSREGSGQNIEANALPLGQRYLTSLAILLAIAVGVLWMALGGPSLRTLGDRRFGTVIFFAVAVCIGVILADTLQLLNTWSQLRQLLVYLDRLRLRRTLATLRGLYGGSVWKLSGNVLEERYRLISRQFESMRNLQNALTGWIASNTVEAQCKQIAVDQMAQCEKQGRAFAEWYVDLLDDDIKDPAKEHDIRPLAEFQEMLAATAGCIMKQVIMPAWQTDSQSLIRSTDSKDKDAGFDKLVDALPPHLRAAEEFFVLPYMGFIQNTLGRVRTIGLSIVTLFVAVTIGVSCYPFDPLQVIGGVFLILFVLVGAALFVSYAEMCRDATLSRISDTNPGELGWGFFAKMAALGAGPLLGLLTTLFPSMTDFIVSFLQPGAQAIK